MYNSTRYHIRNRILPACDDLLVALRSSCQHENERTRADLKLLAGSGKRMLLQSVGVLLSVNLLFTMAGLLFLVYAAIVPTFPPSVQHSLIIGTVVVGLLLIGLVTNLVQTYRACEEISECLSARAQFWLETVEELIHDGTRTATTDRAADYQKTSVASAQSFDT